MIGLGLRGPNQSPARMVVETLSLLNFLVLLVVAVLAVASATAGELTAKGVGVLVLVAFSALLSRIAVRVVIREGW